MMIGILFMLIFVIFYIILNYDILNLVTKRLSNDFDMSNYIYIKYICNLKF